jgi:hypothetical protein
LVHIACEQAVFDSWLLGAPWILGFVAIKAAAWTAWIAGMLVIVLVLWKLQEFQSQKV